MIQLQTIESWSVIAASAFTIFGVIVALISLRAYIKESKKNMQQFELSNKRLAAEKAVEVAKEFQKTIVPNITFLHSVYKAIGLVDYVADYMGQKEEFKFTINEFVEIYGREGLSKLDGFYKSITVEIASEAYQKWKPVLDDDFSQVKNKADAMNFVLFVASDTLNTLEWLCMLLATGVAEDKVVYRSLHQLFLKYIGLEYSLIAMQNKNISDKYYTYIIKIYNKWLQKYKSSNALESQIDQDIAIAEQYRKKEALRRKEDMIGVDPKPYHEM